MVCVSRILTSRIVPKLVIISLRPLFPWRAMFLAKISNLELTKILTLESHIASQYALFSRDAGQARLRAGWLAEPGDESKLGKARPCRPVITGEARKVTGLLQNIARSRFGFHKGFSIAPRVHPT